jgi:2-desacetyl-2-hydroxyethyl bacteriochlorophyllide A dehydrogenase
VADEETSVRAAVISGPGRVEVTSIGDPTPAPGEVVIAVAACGICGTDLHIMQGRFAPTLPVVPGHEFAGEVVALGSGVTSLVVGDRVAVDPNLPCHACERCRRGRTNLCLNFSALGVTIAGGAAEYVAAPAGVCVKLTDEVRVQDAALVEPLSCAIRGSDVVAGRLGDRVLVYGAGTMGLLHVALASRAGAVSVDVVDLKADRLDAAAQVGASRTATSAAELDAGSGWDVVIDCTGAVGAIEDGLARVAVGGTFLQFGVADEEAVATWSPYRVYRDEITIVGSMSVLNSFDRAVALLTAGAVDPAVIISDRLPLADYPDAIARVQAGAGRKILVTPGHRP